MISLLFLAAAALTPAEPFDPLLDKLSHQAFDYFWQQSHPQTGLTLDRANNFEELPRKDHIASIAATGFALSACAVGAERGWIDRDLALERVRKTLRFAADKDNLRHRGWFYHFMDWETGDRAWMSEVSSIDSSIFLSGMLLADRYFRDPQVSRLSRRILDRVDWRWMLTDAGAKPNSLFFSMGYHPERGFIEARWDSYNELAMLYVQAYGAYPAMPKESWNSWRRPEVEYEGLAFLAGGPLFLDQMSHVYVDFEGRRDGLGFDYWVQGRNHALAQKKYCQINPLGFEGYGGDIWGLSACDGPDGYRAYGAPVWTEDDGTLAPAATVGVVLFDPKVAVNAAHTFADRYPETLGRYGFVTGFNPTRDWQSPDAIGIDLGQMMLAIENYRDGLPHRIFMSHPVVKRGIERICLKKTMEGPLTERPLRK